MSRTMIHDYKGKSYTKSIGQTCKCCNKDLARCIKYNYIKHVMWKNYKRLQDIKSPIYPNIVNDKYAEIIYFNELPKEKINNYYTYLNDSGFLDHKKLNLSICMFYKRDQIKEVANTINNVFHEYASILGIKNYLNVNEELICRYLKYATEEPEVRKYIDKQENTSISNELLEMFKLSSDQNNTEIVETFYELEKTLRYLSEEKKNNIEEKLYNIYFKVNL